jgi:drug/metabolite transporter (DMT)-like permease
MTRAHPRVLDLLLLAVAAAWGGSFVSAKALAETAGVPGALALRFLVAVIAMAAICVGLSVRLPRGRGLIVAVGLGGSQAAIIGLETWGVSLTSATNAGLLISLALVMTPVPECLAARSWLPRSYFVAATVAVAGVALLVSDGGLRTPTIGDALVVAAAAVRAVHVTASGRLLRTRPEGTLAVLLVQVTVCATVFTALAGDELVPTVRSLDTTGWFHALFLGLLCSVFAFVVQLWAVKRTSATRASILMGTEPAWALLWGILVVGEAIGPGGVAGAVLIIAASYAGQSIERGFRERGGGVPDPGSSWEGPPVTAGRASASP